MRGPEAGSSRTNDDEPLELELGHGETDVGSERTAADLFLYVPDMESPTGWVSWKVQGSSPAPRRGIGFRRDDDPR